MSRTVSGALLAAINAETSFDVKVKATIHQSLMAFGSLDRDYQPSGFYEGVPDLQHDWSGSAAYITAISKATNAFLNGSGTVQFYCNPNGGVITPTYSGGSIKTTCPSLIDGYLYTVEGSAIRYTIDTSALSANNPACLSGKATVGTVTGGFSGIAGISSTECVTFHLTSHGYTVRYYYSGGYRESEDMIIFPTKGNTGLPFYTRFSAARLGDKVFAYVTNPMTGAVMAKVLDVGTDGGGRNWSSTFTAVASDLSEFWPTGSCFVSNGKVHMGGIFRRTEEFASGNYYSLLLSSDDGFSFSMDRFSMITNLPGMYASCTSGTVLYGMCAGGVGESPANYVVGSPTASLVIPNEDILNVNYQIQSPGGQGSIKVANGDRIYDDNAYLEEGNRLQLEMGYSTSGGDDYELMETFIITQVSEGIGDGENSLTLQIQTEAAWRLSNQTAPFYTEMDSNSAVVDSVTNDLDHLYTAERSGRAYQEFYVDMWNSTGWDMDATVTPLDMIEDGGPRRQIHVGSHKFGILTASVAGQNNLMDDPVILEPPIDVSVYGWSRTLSTGLDNDSVRAFLILDDGAGVGANDFGEIPGDWDTERQEGATGMLPTYDPRHDTSGGKTRAPSSGTVSPGTDGNINKRKDLGVSERLDGYKVVEGTLLSTYDKWPQEYFDNVAGSNPISFRWDSSKVSIGDKIIKVGLIVSAPNTSAFGIAGVHINGIGSPALSGVLRWEDTNTPWIKNETYLELPGSGRPFVMFSSKPYYSHNFDVSAKFSHALGGSPAVTGGEADVAFGVVGHAKDAQNYVLGKANLLTDQLQLFLLRHGKETLLAQVNFTLSSSKCWLRLTHRDGVYKLYTKTSDVAKSWGAAKITYEWSSSLAQQIIGETIYVNDKQITTYTSHVGVYGVKHGASFRTCGFQKGNSKAFGLLPGQGLTPLSYFPSSGEVEVNGARYAYTGKTPDARIPTGPWRGESTRVVDWGTLQGVGIDISYFHWDRASTWWEDYILSVDNGHTWIVEASDWQPNVLVDGALEYYARTWSRHICTDASGNYVGHTNKVVIGPGIIGLKARDDTAQSHPYGSFVNLYITNEIRLHYFEASGGDGDMTVADMVTRICNAAGTKAEFPGDIVYASQGISGTPWSLR